MSAGDATLDLLTKLRDRERWFIKEAVPIFTPHERTVKKSDGSTELVKVNEDRLKKIVEVYFKKLQETGTIPRIIPGHTLKDPTTPEPRQPDIWGHPINWRVGTFGPKNQPCILADYFCYPQYAQEVVKYPFRSAEFYPDSNEITAIALLKRDPALDMGLVTYEAQHHCLLYAMGPDTMPDPTTNPPGTDPTADVDYQKFCQFMQLYMAQNPMGMQGMPPLAQPPQPPPMPTPGGPPMPDQQTSQQFARDEGKIQYAKLEAENTELKARLDAIEKDRNLQRAEKCVVQLEGENYVFRDRAKEVQYFLPLSEAAQTERMDYIRAHHAKAPVSDPDEPFVDTTGPTNGQAFTNAHLKVAQQYMKDHVGCKWDEAKAFALGQKK